MPFTLFLALIIPFALVFCTSVISWLFLPSTNHLKQASGDLGGEIDGDGAHSAVLLLIQLVALARNSTE